MLPKERLFLPGDLSALLVECGRAAPITLATNRFVSNLSQVADRNPSQWTVLPL